MLVYADGSNSANDSDWHFLKLNSRVNKTTQTRAHNEKVFHLLVSTSEIYWGSLSRFMVHCHIPDKGVEERPSFFVVVVVVVVVCRGKLYCKSHGNVGITTASQQIYA